MNILKFLPMVLLAACSTNPQTYQAEKPAMDFMTYFTGTTHGYGAIYSFTGKITDRFHVEMQGTPGTDSQGKKTLHIAETFTYTSGKTQQRAWDVTEMAPNTLHGLASDVPGYAEGLQSGNAIRFKYPLTITRESGKQITLSSSDWMWMMPGNTVLNRNQLSKFGIPVAELVIYFTKQAPAK